MINKVDSVKNKSLNRIKIGWFGRHFGEEPPLVGKNNRGAGGIFFSRCNLRCVFCQNWQISQAGLGKEYSAEELGDIMLGLQKDGAVNINLVSPTIWWREIKRAIELAKSNGLVLPIVWNSNAYESVSILKELAGLVDIYLPDFKYGDDKIGLKYSAVINYTAVAKAAIKEMLKQVGRLKVDNDGIARRGVMVRHLILPNNMANSILALKILSQLNKNLPVSLMRQYFPLYKADSYPEINRQINESEFTQIFNLLCELGLENGWVQEENCAKILIPDFKKAQPFVK